MYNIYVYMYYSLLNSNEYLIYTDIADTIFNTKVFRSNIIYNIFFS